MYVDPMEKHKDTWTFASSTMDNRALRAAAKTRRLGKKSNEGATTSLLFGAVLYGLRFLELSPSIAANTGGRGLEPGLMRLAEQTMNSTNVNANAKAPVNSVENRGLSSGSGAATGQTEKASDKSSTKDLTNQQVKVLAAPPITTKPVTGEPVQFRNSPPSNTLSVPDAKPAAAEKTNTPVEASKSVKRVRRKTTPEEREKLGQLGFNAWERKETYAQLASAAGLDTSSYIRKVLDERAGLAVDPSHPYNELPKSVPETRAIRTAKTALARVAGLTLKWLPPTGGGLLRTVAHQVHLKEVWTQLQNDAAALGALAQQQAIRIGSSPVYRSGVEAAVLTAVYDASQLLDQRGSAFMYAVERSRVIPMSEAVIADWASHMQPLRSAVEGLSNSAIKLIPSEKVGNQ